MGLAFVFLVAFAAAALEGSKEQFPDPPPFSTDWVRPQDSKGALLWGRRDGIIFGLPSPGGLPGPRGLVRVGIWRDGRERPDLINFLAFEPVVAGKKSYSELEPSALDGKPGKRLEVSGPVEGQLNRLEPEAGQKDGVEELAVAIECERFQNGAHVHAKLSVRSDRPEELRIKLFAKEDSAAVEENTVTATMGNFARLRRIALRSGWIDSRDLFKGYQGNGFIDQAPYTLERLLRLSGGDVIAAAVSDEADPAAVKIESPSSWQYRSIPLTQYWRVPRDEARPDLRLKVNGRRVYWQSEREIPGGIAFENFELRARFTPGQTFIFGLSRKSPKELGAAP
ncbi:MAG: hypothetical protein HY717_13350 [Planctomycetes bacterium]|nr:hypothetical protein [Planctomycetota bacterium]